VSVAACRMPECPDEAINGLFCQAHWNAVAGSTKRLLREALATAIADVRLAHRTPPLPGVEYRTDGRMHCGACGRKYIDHPVSVHVPFLHVICNGDFVKL
jgi:hypothetical protein